MEAVENFMYHVPRPPRTRKEPMQVMAFGPSRSGTDSLCNALKLLGYNHTYHGFDVPDNDTEAWVRLSRRKFGKGCTQRSDVPLVSREEFDAIIGHCTAVTDLPCVAFAPELLAAYPDAKVILNLRKDLDAWHRSIEATFTHLRAERWRYFKSFFDAEMHWLYRIFDEFFDDFWRGGTAGHGIWVYREHAAMIRGMVPKEKLLEWSVEDGWEPLCRFLDKPMDGLPEFPKGNPPADFAARAAREAVAREARAKRNMAITGSVVAAVVAVAVWVNLGGRRH